MGQDTGFLVLGDILPSQESMPQVWLLHTFRCVDWCSGSRTLYRIFWLWQGKLSVCQYRITANYIIIYSGGPDIKLYGTDVMLNK